MDTKKYIDFTLKYAPLFTAYFVLLGVLNQEVYYLQFGISVANYFTLSEMFKICVSNSILLFYIWLVALTYPYLLKKTKLVNSKARSLVLSGVLVLVYIIGASLCFDYLLNSQLRALNVLLVFFMILFVLTVLNVILDILIIKIKRLRNDDDYVRYFMLPFTKKFFILMNVAFFIFHPVEGYLSAYLLKKMPKNRNIELLMKDGNVVPPFFSSYLFGKSEQFYFVFNDSTMESTVIKTEDVSKIKYIVEKYSEYQKRPKEKKVGDNKSTEYPLKLH